MDWTTQQIATLTELWPGPMTTTEIGRVLHMTKSAVTGKAHRLHLAPRPSPIRNTNFYNEVRGKAIKRWHAEGCPDRRPPVAVEAPKPQAAPSVATKYAGQGTEAKPCAYPLGERREFRECGADRVIGKPYCPDHCAISFVRVMPQFLKGATKCPSP